MENNTEIPKEQAYNYLSGSRCMNKKQIVKEFTICSGIPTSQLSKINIVGKKIKYLKLLEGAWSYFDYHEYIPPQACNVISEAVLCICFEDGNVLELFGWDESIDVSFNYYSNYPEFKEEKPDLIIDNVINKYVSGQTVVSSTFNGKEVNFEGFIPIMTFCPTIELENEIIIRFEATYDNTLVITLFKNRDDLYEDKYLEGSFYRDELVQLVEKTHKTSE